MVTWMDRSTELFTHMGGEGANWIGIAPFTETRHMFVNIGDGTYYHSGLLAIRAAVASGANVTYKILYNDAVAMTGGQSVDGPLDVPMITRQLAAEGVERIAVVSDAPEKYSDEVRLAPTSTVLHRDALDGVQRAMRDTPGTSAIVYDQTCAAEKRRRRKRGREPDPPRRAFINALVCEGCGDCGVQSNCVSIVPLETPFGRKRAIDQSSCNKDYSCVKGFCPSFVTVHGGDLRRTAVGDVPFPELPLPSVPDLGEPYGIVFAGIGGTGVVTVASILGMAAHMEGKGVTVLDQIGLAQKNGAVVSHVRIAASPDDLHAARIAAGGARLLLGCDMVAAAAPDVLAKLHAGLSRAVVDAGQTMTAHFTQDADFRLPESRLRSALQDACGACAVDFVDCSKLTSALLGDSATANVFALGFAWQRGLVPVSAEAIEKAIALNGVAIDINRQAFLWGRRAAHDPDATRFAAGLGGDDAERPQCLSEIVAWRSEELAAYQSARYAHRYEKLVECVRKSEADRARGCQGLAEAVARSYFKLLAYKDEYEVARLYSDGRFEESLRRQFEGEEKRTVHLAPPLFAKRDPETGVLRKREYGPWVFTAFRILARFKRLRGTPLDVFGYTHERRTERRLVAEYEATVRELAAGLGHENHALACEIAGLPERVRGFGHVKSRSVEEFRRHNAELLERFRQPAPRADAAA